MIEPIIQLAARGKAAADDLFASELMLSKISIWDDTTPAEKAREYALGRGSSFSDVPGFTPVACLDCRADVHPDFRNVPEGECPVDAGHELWASAFSDQAAA